MARQGRGVDVPAQSEGRLKGEIAVAWSDASLVDMTVDAASRCGARLLLAIDGKDQRRTASLIYRGAGKGVFGEIAKLFPGYAVRFVGDDVVLFVATNSALNSAMLKGGSAEPVGDVVLKCQDMLSFKSAVRALCQRADVCVEDKVLAPFLVKGTLSFVDVPEASRTVGGVSGSEFRSGQGALIEGLVGLLRRVYNGAIVMSSRAHFAGDGDEDASRENCLGFEVVGSADVSHLSEVELLAMLERDERGRVGDVAAELARRGSVSVAKLVDLAMEKELNYSQNYAMDVFLSREENHYTDIALRFAACQALRDRVNASYFSLSSVFCPDWAGGVEGGNGQATGRVPGP